MYHRDAVVITKPELRFGTDSNSARGVLEIGGGEDF